MKNPWTRLGVVHQLVGIGVAPAHLFLAQDLSSQKQKQDKEKKITLAKMPFAELEEKCANKGIDHAATIALVFRAKKFLEKQDVL